MTVKELRNGYRIITGLDDKELTDEQIINYMKEFLEND